MGPAEARETSQGTPPSPASPRRRTKQPPRARTEAGAMARAMVWRSPPVVRSVREEGVHSRRWPPGR